MVSPRPWASRLRRSRATGRSADFNTVLSGKHAHAPRQNRFHPRTPMLLGRRTTCSEPVAVVERAARGARVVPVAGELSRRPDDDLAVLAGIQHPRPRLRVHDLQPRQAASVPRPTGRIAAGCHPDWRPGCPNSR